MFHEEQEFVFGLISCYWGQVLRSDPINSCEGDYCIPQSAF